MQAIADIESWKELVGKPGSEGGYQAAEDDPQAEFDESRGEGREDATKN